MSGASSGDELCHFIVINDDDILEANESFTVSLTSNEPGFLGSDGTIEAVVTIEDFGDRKYCLLLFVCLFVLVFESFFIHYFSESLAIEVGFQQTTYNASEQIQGVTICTEILSGSLERDVEIGINFIDGIANGETST